MRIIPDVPLTGFLPNPDLSNTVQHFGFFTSGEISRATHDGSLLMIDLDFGRKCSLYCPGCFRRDNLADLGDYPDLSYEELIKVVDEAQGLGLQSIKICGAGEPFEDSRFLQFAADLTKREIGLAIFTKGHVLGDDELVADIFGPELTTSRDLAEKLFTLKINIMLSFPSFDGKLLCALVGDKSGKYPFRIKRAAEVLAIAGFNRTLPTRMVFVHDPITRQSISGAFEIYQFARERNILPLLAFHMVSGRQINQTFLKRFDPTPEQKLELFHQIYEYNLRKGFNTKEQLVREGISCMPGIHPCNQIAVGLYLTANGNLLRCPGDFGQPLGNVRRASISEVWKKVRGWEFRGRFNCGCPYKDGITIPTNLYDQVKSIL